ncbi:hypothetical protein BDW22DRAFT_1363761 [Trametopsis cervina]|nr:hypothetical protein BDW22DRAFT_1363761 [Trametopsis cervina]
MQNANGGEFMALPVNNVASESAPNVTAAATHNPSRHLNSHIDALHALSTAAQRLAEALITELPAEDTDPSGNEACIRSERSATTVAIEESMFIADTIARIEDVAGTRPVDATRSNTSARDEQVPERHLAQASDVTTSNTSSSPAGFITQGPSSQDLSSGHGEGGTHPAAFSGTSEAGHQAVDSELGEDTENTRPDAYSTSTITLPFSPYDYHSAPDRPLENPSHKPAREGASDIRSHVEQDINESTNAAGSFRIDTAEATDPGGTSGRTVNRRHSRPVYSVRRDDDEGDQSRDGDGSVSTREGTEDRGSGDHP